MNPLVQGDDTIVAVATPPGRGAIAVLRMSGPNAQSIAKRHLTPWPKAPRVATLCRVTSDDGTLLDQTLVTFYPAPRSYTGEDVVEIATHGGIVAPTLIMATLIGSGAREALPGEFTRRAVLNGKLDLVQAEAIGDLIDAGSRAMHSAAMRQLDGGLSQRINALREKIINVEALIAYDIDFPEEDDGPIDRDRVAQGIVDVISSLDALLATAPIGEVIRAGAVVVIAGPPNAGKSSLFNALLGAERAIVTEIPGTTRDALEAVIDAGPWPIRLVDTAGLRETHDVVERIGIEVSTRYLASADVVLACGETEAMVDETVQAITPLTQAPILRVHTKADRISLPEGTGEGDTLYVSATSGEGLSALLTRINTVIADKYGQAPVDAPILTRERHRYAITAARNEMAEFERVWREEVLPPSIAAVHLRTATHALEEVVGAIGVEDILDRLFQAFCVGK
jgi:tRNA modification GTPase